MPVVNSEDAWDELGLKRVHTLLQQLHEAQHPMPEGTRVVAPTAYPEESLQGCSCPISQPP